MKCLIFLLPADTYHVSKHTTSRPPHSQNTFSTAQASKRRNVIFLITDGVATEPAPDQYARDYAIVQVENAIDYGTHLRTLFYDPHFHEPHATASEIGYLNSLGGYGGGVVTVADPDDPKAAIERAVHADGVLCDDGAPSSTSSTFPLTSSVSGGSCSVSFVHSL